MPDRAALRFANSGFVQVSVIRAYYSICHYGLALRFRRCVVLGLF